MTIKLDHLIVPSRNQVEGAKFLATLLDVPWAEAHGNFSPVYVNEALTVDFHTREVVGSNHYAFSVGDAEFDAILGRIRAAGVPYRSSVRGPQDMQTNDFFGGRGVYWNEPDGHQWEMLTVSYARRG